MILRGIALFVLLHLCPRRWLVRRLQGLLSAGGFTFCPQFSGRAAVFHLARGWRNTVTAPVALLPDYICNAVNAAVERAGYKVQTYRTDKLLEPDVGEIEAAIASGEIGILVTANLFGSSALLDQLASDLFRNLILRNRVRVIVDLCQDISLIEKLPANYGNSLAAVVSSNDKSFFGVMGGGILVKDDSPRQLPQLPLRQRLRLYRIFWNKVRGWCAAWITARRANGGSECAQNEGGHSRPVFEYSYCRDFPYLCEPCEPTKLQVILALIGMANLKQINARKQRFAATCPGIRRTRFFLTAPYLMCDGSQGEGAAFRRKVKGSYALHGHPEMSLRPDLVIIHNKGFSDN